MSIATKAFRGILWLAPIHRWTTAVTIAFAVGALVWILAVSLGFTDVAKSPNDVVLDVYRAAQDGNADEVRHYLAKEAQVAFDALADEEKTALMAMLSEDHSTSAVEFLGVRNYGSHAVVGITQDFGDISSKLRVEIAVKEGRYWRLEWPLGELRWAEANLRFDPYYRSSNSGT